MSSVTSRDQPSAVSKATTRTGDEYWPSKQAADQRSAVGVSHVGLGPNPTVLAEIVEHKIDRPTEVAPWDDRRRLTHCATPCNMRRRYLPCSRIAPDRYPITLTCFLFQLKSGRTSAPRLPQCLAGKAKLNIGQLDIIGPGIAADRDRMRALIVGAIDEQLAHAHLAHLSEGDLLRAVGYA